jgi:quercetin dioxygenase-like cupin family protein
MKSRFAIVAIGSAIAASIAAASIAQTVEQSAHKIVLPQDIKWAAAPASLPGGAEAALLYGDMSKEGLFALRVKIPKDYFIPPHTHARPEVVTILSGKFSLGMGPKANRGSVQTIGAGGFFAIQPGVSHYVFAEEETILQITSVGPWGIDYVDPKDDPRLNVAPGGSGGSAQRGD